MARRLTHTIDCLTQALRHPLLDLAGELFKLQYVDWVTNQLRLACMRSFFCHSVNSEMLLDQVTLASCAGTNRIMFTTD